MNTRDERVIQPSPPAGDPTSLLDGIELHARAILHVEMYKENEFRDLRERVLKAKQLFRRRGLPFSIFNALLSN